MKSILFSAVVVALIFEMSSIVYSGNFALSLDGKTSYVACDIQKPKNLPEENLPRTEEIWFKTEWPGPGLVTMIGYGNNSANQMLNILAAGAMITISQWGARLDINAPINDGKWHHVAVVHDGKNTQTVYIDGEAKEPKGSWTLNTVANFCKIGCRIDATVEFFPGTIDEARIWSTARTPEEIKNNMFVSLKGNEPGLVGYWKFDEGNGDTTADATGNNNGRLMNNPKWVTSDIPGFVSISVNRLDKLTATWGGVKESE